MRHPLRFLQVTTFYPPYSFGGDGVYVEGLARLLADAGHSVDVVHCVDAYRLLHPAPPPLPARPHPGVAVHALESGVGWLSPLLTHATGWPVLKSARIREILERRRWDVVHFHNVSLLGPGVLTRVPRDADLVTLYTTHEHWLVCPTHVLWKFNRRPCERPQCLRCTALAGRPPQLWRYTRLLERACAHVDRFVAPSRAAAAMHAARGFRYPMTHLPNFVERADADWRRPPPRPHARPYFLYVGRLEAVKGVQTLVDAWRGITEWDLLVAGTGTLEAALRRAAGDDPRVRLLGAIPSDRLGPLYAHALGCIVPSLGHEVFPLVVLEALSRKVPVVARDFGALGEVAGESGGALLFRDEAGLRAALARLAASPALRAELGERGYRTFVERWSPEAHLRGYLALIDDVAREKRLAGSAAAR
jgi:glycosyltransferase involved in cell wall biosynthesis